jgi:hypothetical protein
MSLPRQVTQAVTSTRYVATSFEAIKQTLCSIGYVSLWILHELFQSFVKVKGFESLYRFIGNICRSTKTVSISSFSLCCFRLQKSLTGASQREWLSQVCDCPYPCFSNFRPGMVLCKVLRSATIYNFLCHSFPSLHSPESRQGRRVDLVC